MKNEQKKKGQNTTSTNTTSTTLFHVRSAGISDCGERITCTSTTLCGGIFPWLGLTQYFFGFVVFTLNAAYSEDDKLRKLRTVVDCFLSSNLKERLFGLTDTIVSLPVEDMLKCLQEMITHNRMAMGTTHSSCTVRGRLNYN